MDMCKALVFFVISFLFIGCAQRRDILIADFEGNDYGKWKVEGQAFGAGPARGTLPNQMTVTGYEGEGLVNSFYGGDDTIGRLESIPFEIKRKYINFLIGGGKHPGETCINLLVNGKVVQTAEGPNDRPGGSEELQWQSWDVGEYIGQSAQIEIVDKKTGGWGHINIDQIYQSDSVRITQNKEKKFKLTKKYLNFPVQNSADKRLISVVIDGKVVREFEISLAAEKIDYWVFLDVGEFKGKDAKLRIDKYEKVKMERFDKIYQANSFPGEKQLYTEALRPQIHFTSKRGWNNDTNGMVYYDGEYHMFYQHNPYGWPWGNMTWGHAVSTDLVHWRELKDAIHPDRMGTIFSGSAVVDSSNSAGFQTGDEKPIVCFYTSAGGTSTLSQGEPFTQSIAYSNDRGRTFDKYDGNPVIGHIRGGNRDPKVIWHEPTQKWVMVLYLDENEMGFFTSDDLKSWTETSRLKCFHECPELFELAVDGDDDNKKWVLYGGAGDYLLGEFDGREFGPDGEAIRFQYGNCFYASQTFNNIPDNDGRRIQMAWGRMDMAEMPFNQMILFPVELSLRTANEGIRMFAEPVREIELLHKKKHLWTGEILKAGEQVLDNIEGELFHIKAQFSTNGSDEFGFVIRDVKLTYNAETQQLECHLVNTEQAGENNILRAKLEPDNGRIKLEILVDRTSLEIFGNDGRLYMPVGKILVHNSSEIKLLSKNGNTELDHLELYELESIWK